MNPLVTPSSLAECLGDPDTVVLDATMPPVGAVPPVDTRSRYVAQHIPGAVFFDIEELSDHSNSLPHMLPTPEEFSRSMAALGVSDGLTIVVYEQAGMFSAPRTWWMLRTMGVQQVYILDGGLRAWIEAGYPTESGEVHRNPANFRAGLDATAVRDFAQIQELIARHAQILDARSAARFAGAAAEPRPGLGSGHMPGSTSVPYTELLDGSRLKPVEALSRDICVQGSQS